MRSHEYLYFYLKHSQSNILFLNFLLYTSFTTPSPNAQNEQFLIEQTWKSNSGAQVTWATKPLAYIHIPMKVKINKDVICERMRDKDIKFIHIISIVTVVYSNGINLKILMSHWRHLTTTFKLPHAQCRLPMSEFISDYPLQILASPHQSDFAPYVSRSYNAQWNAPRLLHDKHILY